MKSAPQSAPQSAIQPTTQPIAKFLDDLRTQDIQLYVQDGRLRCNAPKGSLTDSLRQYITEQKAEIIEFLRRPSDEDSGDQPDLNEIYQPLPQIVTSAAERYQSFPLTEIQQAYLIGRDDSFDLSNVSTHVYAEIDVVDLDLKKFEQAWQYLIQKHEMMRAVMNADGHQQILEQVPDYQIDTLDLRTAASEVAHEQLMALRECLSHQLLPTDTWPLFEVRAALLDTTKTRLFISIDLLIADAWSLELIIRELVDYLHNPQSSQAAMELSFRDYVLAEIALKTSAVYQRSQTYWQNRVATLPPSPELPLGTNLGSIKQPKFVHRTRRISPEQWKQLRQRGFQANLTPSAIILAAFSEVLSAWSKQPRFTLNITLFRRLPLHQDINRLVGDFTSLDLLAIDNSSLAAFVTRAKAIQKQLWQDLDHRYVSGMKVLRDIAHAQQRYSGALMPVVYTSTLTNDSLNRDRFANSSNTESASIYELGEVVYSLSQTPQIYLDHQVLEEQGALILNWDAVDEVFPPGLLDDMFQAYGDFVEALATEESLWQADPRQLMQRLFPPQQAAQIAMVNATEQPLLSSQIDGPQTSSPQTDNLQSFLHGLVLRRLQTSATDIAVVAGDITLTYGELGKRAYSLGIQLRHLEVLPNQLVAVVMKKGWEQVVAVLAVLVSGAAYVPIDPNWPQVRRQQILKQGAVNIVLTQPELDSQLDWPDDVQRIVISRDEVNQTEEHLSGSDAEISQFQPVQTPNDLAYVIYTSGSTGIPKGVTIEHRAVVNTILDINQRFQISSKDRTLAISSLSFDLSVYDIFGTLAAGGTLVVPDAADSKEPTHWATLIKQHQITLWNSVPALMQMLVEYSEFHPEVTLNSLRLVLLSGDWIPLKLPDQIKALSPAAEVVSLGGATEVSIWSILQVINQVDPNWKSIPYGKPMANQQFHILNEHLAPCPVWVPGNLYIGGVGLAREYWRNSEKTSQSFIHHPVTGERLYHTGDLGYYLPDGAIMFLGRADSQVKVQGYRIELGEIETALEQLTAVKQGVVLLKGDAQETKRLVAYVVLEQPTLTPDHLKQQLLELLPDYMVPSTFVFLETLPLTANGKVDRNHLPEPQKTSVASSQLSTSKDVADAALTQQIAQLIANVLKVDTIEPNANLLDLGANSIDIARIANLMEEQFQYRLQIKDLYSLSTVGALAKDYDDRLVRETTPQSAPQSVGDGALAGNFKMIFNPEERQQFKHLRRGLRQESWGSVKLVAPELDDTLKQTYLSRYSCRTFSSDPLPFERFSLFLSNWQQLLVNGQPKLRYGSAGGLYPVQAYLYIKPERISGLKAGTYYYHPLEHQLKIITPDAEIDRSLYAFNNQKIFDQSAFSIFLVGQLAAIAPMYGELSRDFCLLEAGLMSQQLELAAPAHEMGLCQIGSCDFETVRHLFALDEHHIYLYCLLGGALNQQAMPTVDLSSVTTHDAWEEGTL
ncbi:non-ribosomal peptide synthetase [Adonisia turfae]|uniref:Amino acid adenylation domain-containing protein n=1 Tax=Adonisia turfae CCMR0081 TaxID=2292702 RepID=A0A6M0RIH9_9CYAN|nr:non-ribosomal peptide synthetase [Adonisia turfae]NEZ55582.1 amino acid adenylation domain-containing protein [Adonisia turfae CCMR0081]